MCCFSGPVESVSGTNIFARKTAADRQVLVYSMKFSAKDDVAMILPLPVPAGTKEDALRFIDLKGYPDFFADLLAGFPPPPQPLNKSRGAPAPEPEQDLKVVEVGDFEASFVPTVKDFGRLDARFRLADATWDALPAYKDSGFAVFKLKKEAKTVHPMAFEFPREAGKKLFFPTVHIHDGKVHPDAVFDHSLYCQKRDGEATSLLDWSESELPATRFMKIDKTKGLVDGAAHGYRNVLRGERKNEDILA